MGCTNLPLPLPQTDVNHPTGVSVWNQDDLHCRLLGDRGDTCNTTDSEGKLHAGMVGVYFTSTKQNLPCKVTIGHLFQRKGLENFKSNVFGGLFRP